MRDSVSDQLLSTLDNADIAISNAEDAASSAESYAEEAASAASSAESTAQDALSSIESVKNELANLRPLIEGVEIKEAILIRAIRTALAAYDET